MLSWRTVQLLHRVAIVLVLVLVITACAPTSRSPATPITPTEQQSSIEPEPDPEPDPEPEELSQSALAGSQLVIYSGRTESLVGLLIERFEEESGIEVAVRYGGTAELAATILEEGPNSPADVFYAQDAGALGALAKAGRLQELPPTILDLVDARFRSPEGLWVGTSGRARVVVYNTERLSEEDLPDSIWGFTDPEWKSRIGWAPTNGSFQAFVTALRILEGDEAAREWLSGILANDPKEYPSNTTIVDATANGEVDVGFVNHYYLYRFLSEAGEAFPARNYHPRSGGAGALVNVAGAGILDTAGNWAAADTFIEFLLSEEGQRYFAHETHEYPLIATVEVDPRLTPLSDINTPDIDLSNLDDLRGTLELLQEVGAL
jgi:iron(III) transport system substrate-binding protein